MGPHGLYWGLLKHNKMTLTHFSPMECPTLINWTSLVYVFRLLGKISFLFHYFYRIFRKITMGTLIRQNAASDLGLQCLPMSHKKDARPKWA